MTFQNHQIETTANPLTPPYVVPPLGGTNRATLQNRLPSRPVPNKNHPPLAVILRELPATEEPRGIHGATWKSHRTPRTLSGLPVFLSKSGIGGPPTRAPKRLSNWIASCLGVFVVKIPRALLLGVFATWRLTRCGSAALSLGGSTRPSSAPPLRLLPLLLLLLLLALPASAQVHSHYAAGFLDTNGNSQPDAGEPLRFVGDSGTSKTFHLLARPVGQRCGGYYMLDERPRTLFPNDAFSFIAKSNGEYDADTAGHAHSGAYIWMEIVSVSGPPGAKFGFWEEGYTSPTVSFDTNQPTGNFQFVLSEGFDFAGEDPFGHIHGRAWTADKPGEYLIGMRLVDLSTNRPGGGPWHTPSQVYTYRFSAGPSFQPAGQLIPGTGYVLTWKSEMGHWTNDVLQSGVSFGVERATSLSPANWQNIGTVLGTTAATISFTDPSPPPGPVLYRLKYQWSTP